MMILKEHNISVRLPQERAIDTGIVFVQNDKDVYKLNIRVFDGVNEIHYSEVESATITFAKSDGKVVQGDMQVEVDKLTYVLGTNEIAAPGKLIATIQLLGANERLTTARFLFRVEKDLITEDAVKSTSEFAILQRLKEELEAIDVVDLTNQFNAHKAEFESHKNDIAINVRDFGAIGDGVTDDSTPIQNAIDHVESLGGGTVLLPNGTYLIKKSLLLPSNIHFKGRGKETVIKGDFGSLVDPVLIGIKNCDTATGYDAAENITISDIAIDSPNTNGIGLAHAKNIKIYNIYGISVYWHFVDITGCQNVILDRIFAEGEAINSPIQFDNLTGYGGLKIFDGVSEKNANVDGTVIDNAVLTNSIIEQTSTTNYGIHLHRSGGRNITIRDCTITGSMHGIYQDENTQWENVVVDNVRFYNQHVRAVWFRAKASNPIEHNKNLRIINCVAEGFGYQGFVVDRWTDVLIDKCIANGLYDSNYGTSHTNISIWDSPNFIVSNVILGGEYKSPFGMRVVMPSSKNVIITNSIIKNANIGLAVDTEAETIHAGLLFVDVDTPIALVGGGTIGSYPTS